MVLTRFTLDPTRARAPALALVAAALLVGAPLSGAVVEDVDALRDPPLPRETMSPAFNLFVNSEMEACLLEPVETPRPTPASHAGETLCPPWLLRTAPPGEAGEDAATTMRPLYLHGHGGTTSLRMHYDARDGDAYLGQFFGVDEPATVTPWRSPQQVTLDYRVDGNATIGFVADARDPDGNRALVHAVNSPRHIPEATTWERATFTFDLGDLHEPRWAITSLWFVIHADTPDGRMVDVDNVYTTNVYLDPYVAP